VEVPVLDVGTCPPQPSLPVPPPAVQPVALLLVQVRLAAAPACSEDGVALNVAIVAAGGVAVTMTLSELGVLVPPGPVQVNVYVTSPMPLIGPTALPVLDTGTMPLQPSAPVPPLAAHAVAPLLDQANEVDCPVCTVVGEAVKELMPGTGGAAATSTVTEVGALLPPGPVQVSV
jgi:hypothetical protein